MRIRRILAFTAVGVAALVVLAIAFSKYQERKQPVFQNFPQLIQGLQAFCADQASHGKLPPTVSLKELVARGYLSTNDVRAFEGMDLAFSTHYAPTNPQEILAHTRPWAAE